MCKSSRPFLNQLELASGENMSHHAASLGIYVIAAAFMSVTPAVGQVVHQRLPTHSSAWGGVTRVLTGDWVQPRR